MGLGIANTSRRRPFMTVTIEQAIELLEKYAEEAPGGELSLLQAERLQNLAAVIRNRIDDAAKGR